MKFTRIVNHLLFGDWHVRRAFSAASLRAIGKAIEASEQKHGGEIRFVVEACLDGAPLWAGQSTRERAIDVFSQLRMWDTERNNGVLIYLLLADRSVEIIADRGIHGRTGSAPWATICRAMELAFLKSNFESGALTGIASVAIEIARHFPAQPFSEQHPRGNELPNAPLILS